MHSTVLNITFDCTDAGAQAAFWAAVTGGSAEERDATPGHVEYVVLPLAQGMPRLYFTTVPEPKQAKNRLHLDILPADGVSRPNWRAWPAWAPRCWQTSRPARAGSSSPTPKATSSAWKADRAEPHGLAVRLVTGPGAVMK